VSAGPFRQIGATTWLVLVCLLASSLAGCGRGRAPVPDRAQQVHVQVVGSEVRLDPATVPAGDVYVVLDTPRSSVGFAQRQATAEETPGPLRDPGKYAFFSGDLESGASGNDPRSIAILEVVP
jgi:hypothetical protein